MTVPLAQASTVVDAAIAAARKAGLNPLTVVVLDAGGHMVAVKREDRSGILRVEVATGKAYAALGMGVPTRLLRDRLGDRPNFVSGLSAASDGRFIAVPGGVLIREKDGAILGAVGISGDASDKDEYCAIEGVKAAGLTPDPAEPNPNWRDAAL
ncbi:MAG: GlcG/HbpS family heme-binding protein [Alphaproteobacteria bacterium]